MIGLLSVSLKFNQNCHYYVPMGNITMMRFGLSSLSFSLNIEVVQIMTPLVIGQLPLIYLFLIITILTYLPNPKLNIFIIGSILHT